MNQVTEPAIQTWDELDEEVFYLATLAELVWDFATDVQWTTPPDRQHVSRLHTVSFVLKERVERFRDNIDARVNPLRRSAGKPSASVDIGDN